MAQQLRQLALPIEEPLLRAIRGFDCLGVDHAADPVAADVALRFLLADANVRKVNWYRERGFVGNRAQRERGRTDPDRSISMRLDLLEALSDPEREDRALLVAALE